ncbi:hypothetical protein AB1K62_08335 [Parasphingorhabdus sp. JC815]|uniref:hypothetical protein n=1 Tax=Parasphingorhabdus sp. JC815 TaxID=3232140 RepID=UPI00345AF9F2
MLVKTPAIKLGVEIRESKTEDGKLILSGVANAMPCTVEMSGPELRRLAAMLLHPKRIFKTAAIIFGKKPEE